MCKRSRTTGTFRDTASYAKRAREGAVAEDNCREQSSYHEQHESINTFVLVN